MKPTIVIILLSLVSFCRAQQAFVPQTWGDWQTWGEQKEMPQSGTSVGVNSQIPGGGEYVNPVIPADFSDIDCIEHEGYYYAISSTFQFEPGMVILRSADMVNWQVYSHAVPDVSQISEIAFVRPTAGHAYVLEGSLDGQTWTRVGGHDDCQKRSPHTDRLEGTYRYLRLTITLGIKGVYEWNLYE